MACLRTKDDASNRSSSRNVNTQMERARNWETTENRMKLGFLGLILIVMIAFLYVASTGVKSSAIDTSIHQAATFTGAVTSLQATNDHVVLVNYRVKNISKSLGLPSCNLYIQDPSGSFPGYSAHLTINWTKPGMTSIGKIAIPVSSPGSKYVTQGNVSCN